MKWNENKSWRTVCKLDSVKRNENPSLIYAGDIERMKLQLFEES